MWYSDWISAPLLGVNSRRKCGSRCDHGPGRPSCSVAWVGSLPRIGWRGTAAGRAPGSSAGGSPARRLSQTCSIPSPAGEDADRVRAREDVVGPAPPRRAPRDVLAHVVGGLDVEPRAGRRRPSAPSATTWPSKPGSPRRTIAAPRRSVAGSSAATAVARLPVGRPTVRGGRDRPGDGVCGSEARPGERHALAGRARWRARRSWSPPGTEGRAPGRGGPSPRRARRRASVSSSAPASAVNESRVQVRDQPAWPRARGPARPTRGGVRPGAVGVIARPVRCAAASVVEWR